MRTVFILLAALSGIAVGCNNPSSPPKPDAPKVENADYAIASNDYVDVVKTAFDHFGKFEYDAWGAMLAEDVEYSFPDGDVGTRTKLVGKPAVISWWKNWQKTSGVQSMTFDAGNFIPFNALKAHNAGALPGIYVVAYLSNKMVFNGAPVAVRMNFSIHFNSEKLIDRYVTYYDRTPIIKAMKGKNYLEATKAK